MMGHSLLRSIRKVYLNPYRLFAIASRFGFFSHMSDERYLKLLYRGVIGRELHLDPPVLYSEKIQWLKLHDKNPLYPTLCDKLAAREFVRQRVGEEHVIDLLGVWERAEQIDFATLPEQFVLKCTHDSGSAIVCRDRSTFDPLAARTKLHRKLRRNYSLAGREWPYRDVPRRILAEHFLTGSDGAQAEEYKFFCFHGTVRLLLICTNHENRYAGNYTYLPDFSLFPVYQSILDEPEDPNRIRPQRYEEMIQIAERISAGFVHMRVDLYDTKDGIKVGELTLHSSSGLSQTMTERGDRYLGECMDLDSMIASCREPETDCRFKRKERKRCC